MKIKIYLTSLLLLFMLAACDNESPVKPYVYENEPEFTWGYGAFYGKYYSNYNLNNNVLSLNLFTSGLTINENNELTGIGQYLILEDVFVSPQDSTLTPGTYTLAESGEPFTFFSGSKFEDNNEEVPSGAYMYYIEVDESKSKIVYIKEGIFTVSRQGNGIYSIDIQFRTNEKTEIKAHFNVPLDFYDLSAVPPAANAKRFLRMQKR
ncbi:MAG: Ig domain protein group 2 domain protein [Bacteroidetes bacterium]|nr:Ig domain protein group 2 domain protein [Bacteroidota bacterium]